MENNTINASTPTIATATLHADCKKAFLEALSYIPPAPTGPTVLSPDQQLSAAIATQKSTLDQMSTIFADNMLTAFDDALRYELSNFLPAIKFSLVDSLGKHVTGSISFVTGSTGP